MGPKNLTEHHTSDFKGGHRGACPPHIGQVPPPYGNCGIEKTCGKQLLVAPNLRMPIYATVHKITTDTCQSNTCFFLQCQYLKYT